MPIGQCSRGERVAGSTRVSRDSTEVIHTNVEGYTNHDEADEDVQQRKGCLVEIEFHLIKGRQLNLRVVDSPDYRAPR